MLRVLAVDDDDLNLKILQRDLSRAGHGVVLAQNGEEALEILSSDDAFDVILLDRMMPKMDGMEVLRQLRANGQLDRIPVVMQTAAATNEQIQEGVAAGVFYYLAKPFEQELMLAIVQRAVAHYQRLGGFQREAQEYRQQLTNHRMGLALLDRCVLRFRTLAEVQAAGMLLSHCFPDPARVSFGIHEMLLNAVEHGILGIRFAEKSQLLIEGRWQVEVERRLEKEAFQKAYAEATICRVGSGRELTITDPGDGFDPEPFFELSLERAAAPNGRGIYSARALSFDHIEYRGNGETVVCRVDS